jgi:fatty-acyl-CoA synthase
VHAVEHAQNEMPAGGCKRGAPDPIGDSLLALLNRHRFRPDTFCHFRRADSEIQISFADLFAEASRFRRLYADAGTAPGATIIIAADFSPEAMFAFVGALIGGLVPAFLAPFTERQHLDQFAKTITGVIDYTRPGAIVASAGFDRGLVPPQMPLILTDQAQSVPPEPDTEWATPNPDDVAFMQFSSGTTGLRKGVMLHHRAVVAQIRAFLEVIPLGEGDLIASWLPLYHDMGLIACFIIPMAVGIPVALQDPIEWARRPARLFDAIERHRATHVWLPNFAYNHLRLTVPMTGTRYDLSSLKAIVDCSEPCKAATFDGFAERFAPFGIRRDMLATSYAMAEAVFAVTQSPIGCPVTRGRFDRGKMTANRLKPDRDGVELLSAGRLLPGIELRVLGDDGVELAEGQIGEIALRGGFMFEGYYNNPADTRAAFRGCWFLTGDLGAVLAGEVFITGRRKDVIIVNGKNFYAHDIEAAAAEVPGIKPGRAVAFGVENALTGSEEVVLVAETELDPTGYRAFAGRVKRIMIEELGLSAVRVYPVGPRWLIKTTSGKISRDDNRRRYVKEISVLSAKESASDG